tara:strand:+ start:507 stop:827 length:321 start_codon:yes stop_codon:yes gene_type:complete
MSLSGCASQPNSADIMRGHAAVVQDQLDLRNQLADDYEQGTKLINSGQKRVEKGEKLVKQAEKNLNEGKSTIKKGYQEIREGNELMLESERRYRENFPEDGFPLKQ